MAQITKPILLDETGKSMAASLASIANQGNALFSDIAQRTANLENNVSNLNAGGLNLKDDVISEQVQTWLDKHPEATTTVQDGALTEEKFSNELKLHTIKDYVTPEMFGAIGDGVADDTVAFEKAMESGKNIYMLNTYMISKTIHITKKVIIEGSQSSKVRYTGTGFLFSIETNVWDAPIIRNITFSGNENNSFISCNRNGWGGAFTLENFGVYNFDINVFSFMSAACCYIKNGRIYSNGSIVFDSHNGVYDEFTFSNGNTFENVYYTGKDKDTLENIFEMHNVRELTLINCMFEKAKTCFNLADMSRAVKMIGGWLEKIDNICVYDDTSNPINRYGVIRTEISYFDGTNENLDIDFDRTIKYVNLKDSGGNKFNKIVDYPNEYVLAFNLYNKNDGYSEHTPLFRIGTKDSVLNSPLNSTEITATDTDKITFNWANKTFYSGRNTLYEYIIVCSYEDTSTNVFKVTAFQYSGTLYYSKPESLYSNAWDGSQASTNTLDVALSESQHEIIFTSSIQLRKFYLRNKYEFV